MKTRISARKPMARLNMGNTILLNAEGANTKAIKRRLEAFAEAHRSYAEAHAKADEADKALAAQQAEVSNLDVEQDDAVEALAVALINADQPRANPFVHFGDAAPGTIKAMPVAEEAAAIHTLVATLKRSKTLPQAARSTAEQADQAAHKLEAALPLLETRRNQLKGARSLRDSLALSWDGEISRLRLATRSAAIEAPGLYEALFGRSGRKKANGVQKQPGPAAPTPAASPDSTSVAPAANTAVA